MKTNSTVDDTCISIGDKAFKEGSVADNLAMLKRHGFTHVHFAHKWTDPLPLDDETLGTWCRALELTGMRVLDVHGCHPRGMNLWEEDETARSMALEHFAHRLRVAHALGADAMVYHVPVHVEPARDVLDRFIDGLARMEPLARELGIVVALENHYLAENDKRALSLAFETFSPEYIGFTLDPGHAMISGNFDWIMENCGPRLRSLHLNDNDGIKDFHWNPFAPAGRVDWHRVARFIAGSPYDKPLQLEVCFAVEQDGTHEDFLEGARLAAVRLASQIAKGRCGL